MHLIENLIIEGFTQVFAVGASKHIALLKEMQISGKISFFFGLNPIVNEVSSSFYMVEFSKISKFLNWCRTAKSIWMIFGFDHICQLFEKFIAKK